MSNSILSKLRIVAVVCVGSLLVLQVPTLAADGPVLRTFAFVPLGTAAPPDYLADDSLTLTALPDAAGDSTPFAIEFSSDITHYVDANGDPLPFADFRGTNWVSRPAHHSVKGGEKDNGLYVWLLSEETPAVPPVGAHAFTGPDGSIVSITEYRIVQCAGGNCSAMDVALGRWHFTEGTGGKPFLIVTAWFSR